MRYISNSVEETEQIGAELSRNLPSGSIVAFTGDLGAGKTAFVRGMARGLGIEERVTSPTFTIVNEYDGGTRALFHFDLYSLKLLLKILYSSMENQFRTLLIKYF